MTRPRQSYCSFVTTPGGVAKGAAGHETLAQTPARQPCATTGYAASSRQRSAVFKASSTEPRRSHGDGSPPRRGSSIWMRLISIIPETSIDSADGSAYGEVMQLDRSARQLEALGNPTRLRVYRALVRAGDPGLPVGRLQARVGVPASTLSHHLHRLIVNGLVSQERQGTVLICRANYAAMRALIGFLADECCADTAMAETASDAA